MALSFGIIVTFVGGLLLAGVLSNKLSSKFNMPILLLFLAVGMTVGAHGLGIVHLEPDEHAGPINSLGTVAMCFILFSGGLGTRFRSIRPVIRSGVTLATAGVILTAIFLGVCGYLICLAFNHNTGFAWWMLMASIISSTDAAAMFAILRGNGVNLSGDLQPLLELESGSNDPMAALLTLIILQIVTGSSGFSFWQIPLLLYKIVVGAAMGLFMGYAGQKLFGQRFEYEGLYYVLGVALVLICFGVAELPCTVKDLTRIPGSQPHDPQGMVRLLPLQRERGSGKISSGQITAVHKRDRGMCYFMNRAARLRNSFTSG